MYFLVRFNLAQWCHPFRRDVESLLLSFDSVKKSDEMQKGQKFTAKRQLSRLEIFKVQQVKKGHPATEPVQTDVLLM